MKPIAAILLMAVFAFSQYGKQLSYMECKLANSVNPSAQQCDCEKKYNIHIQDDKKPVALHKNFAPLIDELYSPAANEVNVSCFNTLPAKPIMLPSADASKGNCSTPYRPPQA